VGNHHWDFRWDLAGVLHQLAVDQNFRGRLLKVAGFDHGGLAPAFKNRVVDVLLLVGLQFLAFVKNSCRLFDVILQLADNLVGLDLFPCRWRFPQICTTCNRNIYR
jgi:hypothetical protein